MEPTDTYKTISKPVSDILLKERKSKFYGYAFPITDDAEVKPLIDELRKAYPTANHVCYAWQLGVENYSYRANDDGEPNNSAGMPIYGQIQSFNVTNILIAVVRIFGGTKLGVGGLISAYKGTAQLTLENSRITEKIIKEELTVSFEYAEMDTVMRFIKKNQLNLISQELHMNCKIIIAVRRKELKRIQKELTAYHKITVSK
ncbi:IMPACT family protein [Maribacter antarcticus]|uniref:IMPACT family protein n=1 Tax=Maribacter antarcticus TaxID=505250 RepID=UPI00047D02E6|nr:YigZ family protein [Maribacter antarcticus]